MLIIRRGILTQLSFVVLSFALMAGFGSGAAHAESDKGDALGSISVLIIPPGAVAEDAQWNVDGGAFVDSEQVLNGLSVGDHFVCFQDADGYEAPPCRTVTVRENETTFVVAEYTPQRGSITVAIQPDEVVLAGAQWRVDGGPLRNDGDLVNDLSLGDHVVSFAAVPGWVTPANQVLKVFANEITDTTGVYVRQTGSLTVTINPPEARSAGAQWNVDGGGFANSGITRTGLSVGEHIVSFSDIPGWITPQVQFVSVRFNQNTAVIGTYQQLTGGIQVTITPPEALAAGAQWQIDNGPLQSSDNILTGLSAGSHTLSFTNATGFNKPPNRQITIVSEQIIQETGVYTEQEGSIRVTIAPEQAITAGARWRVDDSEDLLESGATLSGLALGEHLISFTEVADLVTPSPRTVTVTNNQITDVAVTYGLPTGDLTVNIIPTGAVDAGAQWRIAGGEFQDSGATLSDLVIGTYTVSFTIVTGFDKPANQTVTITRDQTTTATGVYTPQFGGLTVTLSPSDALAAGAQWKVDGGPYQNSGAVVNDLSFGEHLLTFKPIAGFATPGNKTVSIGADQITSETGVYSRQTGNLAVYLTPASAIAAGAQWQVDSRDFQGSGTIANDLAVGPHTVYFKSLPGFRKPDDQVVNITDSELTTITVDYSAQVGSLTVSLTPAAAVAAGAQWRVDGGTYRNSGSTLNNLAYGAHTISFKPVAGYATPANKNIFIEANQLLTETADYPPAFGGLRVTLSPQAAVAAGAQWQVDGGDFQNSGATLNNISYGEHTISFKPVSGFPTPANKTIVIKADQVTNATAEYSTQTGALTVSLTPPAAVSAGAQWRVEDSPFQNSATTINRLGVGTHTIFFKTITGFPTPEAQTVSVVANQTTSATGVYAAQTGGLTVTLTPAAAVAAGAQWRVDGGGFQDSGGTVNDLAPGNHVVNFKPVDGFPTPDDISVAITAGEITTATAEYTAGTGSITVTLSPSSAVAAGASWKLDNGATQASGTTLNNIPVGAHTLSFTEVSGFSTPVSQTITIVKDSNLTASVTYTENAAACCAGGKQVKSFREAFELYKGDLSLLFGAMVTLVAMSRFRRTGV